MLKKLKKFSSLEAPSIIIMNLGSFSVSFFVIFCPFTLL